MQEKEKTLLLKPETGLFHFLYYYVARVKCV